MRVLLFTGKGGVGKTTLAAATAAGLVARGQKTLVISTDPAHSLGDALQATLTGDPIEIGSETIGGLFGVHIDTRRLVDQNWKKLRGHLGVMLSAAGVHELEAEELTVLPGVEELLALSEVYRLTNAGPWENVVVDCGPTAETLRLLALPEAFANYLERLFPMQRRAVRGMLARIAGSAQMEQWDAAAAALSRLAQRLSQLRNLLADRDVTSVRLVFTPERVVAAETERTLTALAVQGIRVDGVVANRLVPDFADHDGPAALWLSTRRAEQQAVLDAMRTKVGTAVYSLPHYAEEPVGVEALLKLAAELYPDIDPLDLSTTESGPLLSVRNYGRGLDSLFELHISLPLNTDAEVDLVRVDDALALTIDQRRRLIALPAVLCRCQVIAADVHATGILVRFQPDPALWPSSSVAT